MSEPAEKRIATKDDPRIYKATPRGIGYGGETCFVCGADGGPDCAFFVPSRETGERIVELFPNGKPYLDYRHFEPNWIQVKVCVCEAHRPALEQLVSDVRATGERLDGPGFTEEMIQAVFRAAITGKATTPTNGGTER